VFNSHHPWPVAEMWPQSRGVPTPRVGLVLGFDASGLSLVSWVSASVSGLNILCTVLDLLAAAASHSKMSVTDTVGDVQAVESLGSK